MKTMTTHAQDNGAFVFWKFSTWRNTFVGRLVDPADFIITSTSPVPTGGIDICHHRTSFTYFEFALFSSLSLLYLIPNSCVTNILLTHNSKNVCTAHFSSHLSLSSAHPFRICSLRSKDTTISIKKLIQI